jgi:hypothetical protein
MKKLVLSVLLIFIVFNIDGAGLKASVLSDLVNSARLTKNFRSRELFEYLPSNTSGTSLEGYITKCVYLKINKNALSDIINKKPENITFKIPIDSRNNFEFELIRSQVLTDDFKTASLSGEGNVTYFNYTPGVYYRGIIKGDNSSWAALSIFDDFVMLVASGNEGNFNLGSLRNGESMYSDNYIFYNDIDLKIKNNFECFSDENSMWKNHIQGRKEIINNVITSPVQGPIRKYFECDYKMYQDFGSNITNVNNYVTAIYNSNIAFYQNAQINTVLQSVYIWTTLDPYANTNDLFIILKRLGGRVKNNFNGNLAQYISTRTNTGGGIAWIDVLCYPYNSGDSSGPTAVSIIDTMHRAFPIYSWTTNVLCHEMGHNVGSPHTHSCSWTGGAIDSCYHVEGNCYTGPAIPRIGTIMSYCHSNGSINLSLGFGTQPGNLVRQRYNSASCLIGIQQIGNSVPEGYSLSQNYPNPFNPSTKIFFEIPADISGNRELFTELTVYDALGRKVAELAGIKLQPGKYSVDFDASLLPSGVYFYRLNTEHFSKTSKMVLIK